MKTTLKQFSLSILSFITSLLPCSFIEAATSESLALHQGLYIGGELGYDNATMDYHFLFPFTTSHGPSTLDGNNHSAATGFVGGGFLGYVLMLTNHLSLGVELLANGSTASTTTQTVYDHYHDIGLYDGDGYSSRIAIKNNVGVSLLPGILVSHTALVYGRLGYSQAHMSGHESIIFYSEPLGLSQSTTPYTINASPNGFSYGAGIELAVAPRVSIRGEFVHTDYQSIKTQLNNQISMSDNQAMAGLIYHFS